MDKIREIALEPRRGVQLTPVPPPIPRRHPRVRRETPQETALPSTFEERLASSGTD